MRQQRHHAGWQQQTEQTITHDPLTIEQAGHGLKRLAAGIHPGIFDTIGQRQVDPVHHAGDVGHHAVEDHEQRRLLRRSRRVAQFATHGSNDPVCSLPGPGVDVRQQEMLRHGVEAKEPCPAVYKVITPQQGREDGAGQGH